MTACLAPRLEDGRLLAALCAVDGRLLLALGGEDGRALVLLGLFCSDMAWSTLVGG